MVAIGLQRKVRTIIALRLQGGGRVSCARDSATGAQTADTLTQL